MKSRSFVSCLLTIGTLSTYCLHSVLVGEHLFQDGSTISLHTVLDLDLHVQREPMHHDDDDVKSVRSASHPEGLMLSTEGGARVTSSTEAARLRSPNTNTSTALALPYTSHLGDVYVSIKTTLAHHESRLSLLLRTWLKTLEPHQVHIVTDSDGDNITKKALEAGYSVIVADCPSTHKREALCCKSGVEYDLFYNATADSRSQHRYSWYCHFDDDMYVNAPALEETLGQYNPTSERLYLGRYSVSTESQLSNRKLENFPNHKGSSFLFATGAAYCISRALMMEIEPYVRGENMVKNGDIFGYPDDMVVGAVIGAILGYELTNVPLFISHLNSLTTIKSSQLKHLITASYGEIHIKDKPAVKNLLNIPNAVFTVEEDPTRFLSYHCLLYPRTSWCITIA